MQRFWKRLALAVAVMISSYTHLVADESELAPFGHNVFTTSHILKSGQSTGGNYFFGYGLNDYLMVASSPWVWLNYGLANIELKVASLPVPDESRYSLEVIGFKDLGAHWTSYDQDSAFIRLTDSVPVYPDYVCHFGLGFQYFWNEKIPFSLRPFPWNSSHSTVSFGALHEIHFNSLNRLQIETGILGLNYKIPYLHIGLSIHHIYSWGYIQFGFSASVRPSVQAPPAPNPATDLAGYNSWREKYISDQYSDYNIELNDARDDLPPFLRRLLVHPEIQIQFKL